MSIPETLIFSRLFLFDKLMERSTLIGRNIPTNPRPGVAPFPRMPRHAMPNTDTSLHMFCFWPGGEGVLAVDLRNSFWGPFFFPFLFSKVGTFLSTRTRPPVAMNTYLKISSTLYTCLACADIERKLRHCLLRRLGNEGVQHLLE